MNPVKRVLGSLRKADEDYDLISDHDKIAVGVSGGKDSNMLLYCLNLYKKFSHKDYEVIGIYIDLGFGETPIEDVVDYFKQFDCEVYVIKTQIADILKLNLTNQEKISCSLCSKLKKGALINEAKRLGCNKVAYGHHNDDAVETLFMNMIYGARIATLQPKTFLDRQEVTLIRPLIYAYENDITKATKELNIPLAKNPCPNDGNTTRQDIKEMLHSLYHQYPQAKNNFQLMLRNQQQVSLLEPIEKESSN